MNWIRKKVKKVNFHSKTMTYTQPARSFMDYVLVRKIIL